MLDPLGVLQRLTVSDSELERLRSQAWQASRLIEWLDNPNRKPANIAFTSGNERQIAYRVERLLEEEQK